MTREADEGFLREAITLSVDAARGDGGGPFGAVVVRAGEIVGRGQNRVLADGDPTAHAEIVALRAACRAAGSHHLEDAVLYTSCEPCPMCLGAVYWARVPRVVYANTRADAEAIDFGDAFFYRELALPLAERSVAFEQLLWDEAQVAFQGWVSRGDRKLY